VPVGNHLCSLAALRAKAARDRWLASWAESLSMCSLAMNSFGVIPMPSSP